MTIEQLPFPSEMLERTTIETREETILTDIQREGIRIIPSGTKLVLITFEDYGAVVLPQEMESPRIYRY